MMVETLLESSQDFGMANGALPQWKRELLQRRAARSRPAAAPAPPPPPPPPPLPGDEDEELRYGPGIVKRLKSRYLSLALRDAPRRRPSVLRRAASLEHLLDERPPPAPRARLARPVSMATPAPSAPFPRRDSVKRARSVDALSRLDSCEAPAPPSPSPPPPAPRPPALRATRLPRRPAPLLRDAERPPPDVVRSTLRKFESAPPRRPAAAARVSAVLRGLEGARRSLTPERPEPEPQPRSPSPPGDALPPPAESPPLSTPPLSPPPPTLVAPDTRGAGAEEDASPRPVSRAALEGIARAGSSVRYAFEAARAGSHLPPLAATNPVLVARRVGVIRPMPASPRPPTPPPPDKPPPEERVEASSPEPAALVNGHSTPEPRVLSRIGAAGIERAWSGSPGRRPGAAPAEPAPAPEPRAPWSRAPGRPRAPPPAATSVVFNFSNRKEVPDYIENDGIVLRGSRRHRVKAGETGVVLLRPEAPAEASDSEEEPDGAPPSPCAVRFLNDNVLINGRSSMPARRDRDPERVAKLKLQFDDSLTRTFEYPSETSLCEDEPSAPAPLTDNTHMASAALSRYTPSKMQPAAFQLGVTRHAPPAPAAPPAPEHARAPEEAEGGAERGHAVPCGADAARSWSDARAAATDLLF